MDPMSLLAAAGGFSGGAGGAAPAAAQPMTSGPITARTAFGDFIVSPSGKAAPAMVDAPSGVAVALFGAALALAAILILRK